MRATTLFACAFLVLACAGSNEAPADSAAAAPATPAPAATTLSLADLTGKWNQEVRAETGDSVLTRGEMVATADPAGWTMTLPGRPPIPLRVSVDGDSVTTSAGPYESVLRKGVQVTTQSVLRQQDGKLVGITVARYQGAGADSVARLRTELTRAP